MIRRITIVAAAGLLGVLLLVGLGFALGRSPAYGTGNQKGATVIFSDTFMTMSAWQVADYADTGYEWGLAPYSRTVGAGLVDDQGLWAAGGGLRGAAQAWPTGTYTNAMMTVAVAGPFTMTQAVAEVRVRALVLNRTAPGDQLTVALSLDGRNPLGDHAVAVPADPTTWQEISRAAGPFQAGERVWIFLLFISDGSGVDAGPLIDDVTLEIIYSHDVYLPLVRLDPTPTPTPTPTPLPIYTDEFTDPNSGWKTGWVLRHNIYERHGVLYNRWENVAQLSYINNNYRMMVPMDWRGPGGDALTWFVWPAEIAPLPSGASPLPDSYCVETRARIANSWENYQPWWAHWGVVFGANATESGDALTEIYTFQINAHLKIGMLRYHNYVYPGNIQPIDGSQVNVEIPLVRWSGSANPAWSERGFGSGTANYSVLKVWVHGTRAEFYINGGWIASADIGDMPRAGVGLIGGSAEVTPVEVDFDYFRYDPTCTGP